MRKSNVALRLQSALLEEAKKVAEAEGRRARSADQRRGGRKSSRHCARRVISPIRQPAPTSPRPCASSTAPAPAKRRSKGTNCRRRSRRAGGAKRNPRAGVPLPERATISKRQPLRRALMDFASLNPSYALRICLCASFCSGRPPTWRQSERAAPLRNGPCPHSTLSPRAGRGAFKRQVCQRKACCLRCEPWQSLMLTRPGPGVFISWLSASRTSFVSST